jgi:hypothetical protein
MWCAFCGRREEDCPGGIYRGGLKGAEGVCIYCARAALRALDPREAGRPVVLPFPKPGSVWPVLDPDECADLFALGFEPVGERRAA